MADKPFEPTLLMAVQQPTGGHVESEPVLVCPHPDGFVDLVLEDGRQYVFNLPELRAALGDAA